MVYLYIREIKLKISNTFRLLKIYTLINIYTFILNCMELQLLEMRILFRENTKLTLCSKSFLKSRQDSKSALRVLL